MQRMFFDGVRFMSFSSVYRSIFYALLCVAAAKPAFASTDAEFQRLVASPDDPVLNRQFASAAEARGDLRHALAAIERALAAQPGDRALLAEYARIRARMLPSITSVTVQVGASYSSNPRQVRGSSERHTSDGILDAAIAIEDERTLADMRIRSIAIAAGQWEPNADELSFSQISLQSGPVFLLSPDTWLHVAPGVAVAWLDKSELYSEVSAAATVGTVIGGLTQTITARYSWRDGNDDVQYSNAQLLDIIGRFVVSPNIVGGDYLYIQPRYRHSSPDAREPADMMWPTIFGDMLIARDVSPQGYNEWGGRLSYFFPIAERSIYLGVGISVLKRDFDSFVLDPDFLAFGIPVATDEWRSDLFIEPTAHIVLPDFIAPGVDVRADYRMEDNQSNDASREFINHVAGVRIIGRY